MKGQMTVELLISFFITLSFVLLVAFAVHQYFSYAHQSETQMADSLSYLSNSLFQRGPVVVPLGH